MLQNAENMLFSLMFRSGLCSPYITTRPQNDLTLSSAALELVSTAVINCTNSRLSIDVFFATATDMFCCVLHFVFHIFIPISHYLI